MISIWYPLPVALTVWLAKIAIPLLPVVAVVPVSTALPGFTARLAWHTAPRTVFPLASVTTTLTDGVICDPGDVLLGCTENTTVKAVLTVNVRGWVVICGGELASLTWTVIAKLPAAVGVPVITPLLLKVNPVGSGPEPEARLQA